VVEFHLEEQRQRSLFLHGVFFRLVRYADPASGGSRIAVFAACQFLKCFQPFLFLSQRSLDLVVRVHFLALVLPPFFEGAKTCKATEHERNEHDANDCSCNAAPID
jgi:hypothetical protein